MYRVLLTLGVMWATFGLDVSAVELDLVRDLDGRLSDGSEAELEALLEQYRRASGVAVRLETRGLGDGHDTRKGVVEQEPVGQDDAWLLLVIEPLQLQWRAGPAIADRVEPKVMRYLSEKHLAPITVDGDREKALVEGVTRSLAVVDDMLEGRTPLSYLVWKVLESSPASPVNEGLQVFAIVGLRYLLAVLLMGPLVLAHAALAGAILRRFRLPFVKLMLVQLAVIAPLAVLGFVLPLLAAGTEFEALLPYGEGGALFFVLATPLHLVVGLRAAGITDLPWWVLVIAYLLFPVAILVAGAVGPRTGQWAEMRRYFLLVGRAR